MNDYIASNPVRFRSAEEEVDYLLRGQLEESERRFRVLAERMEASQDRLLKAEHELIALRRWKKQRLEAEKKEQERKERKRQGYRNRATTRARQAAAQAAAQERKVGEAMKARLPQGFVVPPRLPQGFVAPPCRADRESQDNAGLQCVLLGMERDEQPSRRAGWPR